MRTEAFRKLGAQPWNLTFPGCEKEGEIWSHSYLACLARRHSCTVWHPCCTCAMGADDERAVVDPKLRLGLPSRQLLPSLEISLPKKK